MAPIEATVKCSSIHQRQIRMNRAPLTELTRGRTPLRHALV